MDKQELIKRIYAFIDKYAAISPRWAEDDEHTDKYTGPDVYQLLAAADVLSEEGKPLRCWSEWGSGCYKPYSSKEGREEHDLLVAEVDKIINNK